MLDKLLLYDTFNARYFSYQEIAESFVPNDEYINLTKNNSVLLMGSRGCGKTTLLKMLTPAGLYYWKGKEAKELKSKINFDAIYIPSDIQWKNQFDYLKQHIDQTDLVELIVGFLFLCNVQIAICKTFKSLIDFKDIDIREKLNIEYEICLPLIENWKLNSGDRKPVPSFDGIELSILERIRNLNNSLKRLTFNRTDYGKFRESLPDYIFDDFFDIIKLGIKVYETVLEVNNDHKWALCFDELEIVPKFIQIKLVKYLRSVDQKFLFKLTTTPLFNLEDEEIDVTQGNDFSPIKLWVHDEVTLKKWRDFCDKLLKKKFNAKYDFELADLSQIFGNRELDGIIKDELSKLSRQEREDIGFSGKFYAGLEKGSSMYFMFKKLAKDNKSFSEFLRKRKIDPNEPYTNDEVLKKSVFLKYKVDAVYRLIYSKRKRITPAIHYGVPHIFDICDGNPRLVIGLIDEILQATNMSTDELQKISKNIQSRVVFQASEKYFMLLKNHPDSTIEILNSDFNLATDLIEKIGVFFREKLVDEDFNLSAPTTFTVDEDINSNIISLLETALYLGAIVYIEPLESLTNRGVLNKRFRLSGFLTPKYKIPNRSNSKVRLSTILKYKKDEPTQRKLF
ncbi:hypothetical protein [uncultured Tenacibaculum sp.]|uniref:ORC-CDC6 family AAA ATPase n=1 Tax=uncultured Tenacibaculum sp. TaxID=174713 RepID=UPI002626B159|nr:hypothetical protein [uncultured Tenacibaculum sp.]